MSNPGTPSTWDDVVNGVTKFVNAVSPLLPLAEAAFPGAAAGIALGEKIVQGALALNPTAIALVKQIQSGVPPTAEQLKAYQDSYEADYQQLKADIAAQLAALPPGQ